MSTNFDLFVNMMTLDDIDGAKMLLINEDIDKELLIKHKELFINISLEASRNDMIELLISKMKIEVN